MMKSSDRQATAALLVALVEVTIAHGRRHYSEVELPKVRGLGPGMRVRVVSGPLSEQIGMLAVLKPRERVLVLLQLLGGQQRVELAQSAVETFE